MLASSPTPLAKLRALIVPQVPESPTQAAQPAQREANCAHRRPVRLSWAKLLKRVFDLDLEPCPHSGGELRIIAAIAASAGDREDPHALQAAWRFRCVKRSAGLQSKATRIGCAQGFRDRWMWRGAKGAPADDARKNAFRLGCPRPTDFGLHPKAGSSASGAVFRPCSVVLRAAVGRGEGRLKSLSPNLVRRSRRKRLVAETVPAQGPRVSIGPLYKELLCEFIRTR